MEMPNNRVLLIGDDFKLVEDHPNRAAAEPKDFNAYRPRRSGQKRASRTRTR